MEDGLEYKCEGLGAVFFDEASEFVHLERVTVQVGKVPFCIRLLALLWGSIVRSHFDAPSTS